LLCGEGENQISLVSAPASQTQTLCVAGFFHGMGTIMGDLVNLKRFRKRAARDQSAQQAEVNRIKFGRSKTERTLDEQRARRTEDLLDQHLIDGEEAQ
jgi:Domain of unknown function (DUF4169)